MDTGLWTYGEKIPSSTDVIGGFAVEASDGDIGHVHEASNGVGEGFIVVDTGPWIFGRKVIIPAGAITGIDRNLGRLTLDLTKDQVKDSPDFDPEVGWDDPDYRDQLALYYQPFVRART